VVVVTVSEMYRRECVRVRVRGDIGKGEERREKREVRSIRGLIDVPQRIQCRVEFKSKCIRYCQCLKTRESDAREPWTESRLHRPRGAAVLLRR